MWLLAICLFLATLLLAALSAAAPAVVAGSARWESAEVSGTVTSHAWFAFCPGQQRDTIRTLAVVAAQTCRLFHSWN